MTECLILKMLILEAGWCSTLIFGLLARSWIEMGGFKI